MPVAPLLGRATCRVTLDQEQFALGRIAFLAIGQFAGQAGDVHRALAPGQLARLLGGFARGGGVDHLLDDRLGVAGVFLQPFAHLVGHQAFERLAHFGADQLVLGLRLENFGSGSLTETIAVSPSRMSSPVSETFSFFSMPDRSA